MIDLKRILAALGWFALACGVCFAIDLLVSCKTYKHASQETEEARFVKEEDTAKVDSSSLAWYSERWQRFMDETDTWTLEEYETDSTGTHLRSKVTHVKERREAEQSEESDSSKTYVSSRVAKTRNEADYKKDKSTETKIDLSAIYIYVALAVILMIGIAIIYLYKKVHL